MGSKGGIYFQAGHPPVLAEGKEARRGHCRAFMALEKYPATIVGGKVTIVKIALSPPSTDPDRRAHSQAHSEAHNPADCEADFPWRGRHA